jgi:hypothetical protein
MDYPWDDKDSLDKLDETANENFEASNNKSVTPPNYPAGMAM